MFKLQWCRLLVFSLAAFLHVESLPLLISLASLDILRLVRIRVQSLIKRRPKSVRNQSKIGQDRLQSVEVGQRQFKVRAATIDHNGSSDRRTTSRPFLPVISATLLGPPSLSIRSSSGLGGSTRASASASRSFFRSTRCGRNCAAGCCAGGATPPGNWIVPSSCRVLPSASLTAQAIHQQAIRQPADLMAYMLAP